MEAVNQSPALRMLSLHGTVLGWSSEVPPWLPGTDGVQGVLQPAGPGERREILVQLHLLWLSGMVSVNGPKKHGVGSLVETGTQL